MRKLLGLIIALTTAGFTSIGTGQSSFQQANFTTACNQCWPGWTEVARPAGGFGPSVRNGAAFIFINGRDADPALNQQHLQFPSFTQPVSEVTVTFQFNNATVGGRLWLSTGAFLCLTPEQANTYVTDEVLVITLADRGDTWVGAFLGDVTQIDPSFSGSVGPIQLWTTIGLLQKRGFEWEVLAVKLIPQATRFSLIQSSVRLESSHPASSLLKATFRFANGGKESVAAESDPDLITGGGTAGLVYLVGNGFPCARLIQRELLVRSFALR